MSDADADSAGFVQVEDHVGSLAAAITYSATEFDLADPPLEDRKGPDDFPESDFYVRLSDHTREEIIHVGTRTGSTCSDLTRGVDSTQNPKAHNFPNACDVTHVVPGSVVEQAGGGGGFTLPANWTIDEGGNLTITDEDSGAAAKLFFNGNRWVFQIQGQGEEEDDVYSVTLDSLPGSGSTEDFTYDAYLKIVRDGGGAPDTMKVEGETGVEQDMPGQNAGGGYKTGGPVYITTVIPATVTTNFDDVDDTPNEDLKFTFANPSRSEQGNGWIVRLDATNPNQSLSLAEDEEARVSTVTLETDGDANNVSHAYEIHDLLAGGTFILPGYPDENDGTGVPTLVGATDDFTLAGGSNDSVAITLDPINGVSLSNLPITGVADPESDTDAVNKRSVQAIIDGLPLARHYFATVHYDDEGLSEGVTLFTPAAGVTLLNLWLEVLTVWDGTTPLADIGAFDMGNTGWFASRGQGAIPLDDEADGDIDGIVSQESGIGARSTDLVQNVTTGAVFQRVLPGRLTGVPIKIVVSQNGGNNGDDPGSSQGMLRVHWVLASAPPS